IDRTRLARDGGDGRIRVGMPNEDDRRRRLRLEEPREGDRREDEREDRKRAETAATARGCRTLRLRQLRHSPPALRPKAYGGSNVPSRPYIPPRSVGLPSPCAPLPNAAVRSFA